ncbi:hypothetical protein HDU67_008009 [Dinochytrium kinnereticum]|nr:hypothetical protein HDU67_008009 [Dinochytrium kinnereticum]
MSLDDFYLPREDQLAIATTHAGDDLLQFRGNPGTHDLGLMVEVLKALKENRVGGRVDIPKYIKSMHAGLGDRAGRGEWSEVSLPVSVVLFEGWCVGFRPLDLSPSNDKLQELVVASPPTSPLRMHPVNHLIRLQKNLETLTSTLRPFLDALIHLCPPSLNDLQLWVHRWRGQQEDELRKRVGVENAMSEGQVREFVDRFLPAYLVGMPRLLEEEDERGDREWGTERLMRIVIDVERRVLSVHVV